MKRLMLIEQKELLANGQSILFSFTQQDNRLTVIFEETLLEARQSFVLSVNY